MSENHDQQSFPRRSFLTRLGLGAAGVSAALGSSPARAAQTPVPAGAWQPARHAEDDWLDQPSARHRFIIDTTTADALAMALVYANNFYTASRTGYNLSDTDSAVVICVRHQSTGFAFGDAMWAKYSASLADAASFTDPRVKQPPSVNIYQATGPIAGLLNRGVTIQSLTSRGLRLAVCQMATRGIATRIADRVGVNVDEVYRELLANRVPNTHMVPAGIVAVSRAQERGYTFGYVS